MADDKVLSAWINPLAFLEVDEPWAKIMGNNASPDFDAVLRFLCAPEVESDLASLIGRYKAVSQEPTRLFAAPLDEGILSKLVWPLRNAKASYMVGNYLGTIALCGMVAEMAAMLLFEISNIAINGRPLSKDAEVKLFGSSFEKLSQQRRVAVLRAYDLINSELESHFNTVREMRRRYLHFYSQTHKTIVSNAIQVFLATVAIVVHLVGQDVKDGKLILNPALSRYLERRGILRPSQGTSNGRNKGRGRKGFKEGR